MWDAAAARRAAQPAPEKKPIDHLAGGNTKEGVAFETAFDDSVRHFKRLAGRMVVLE